MRKLLTLLAVLTLAAPLMLYGCSGDNGSTGATGAAGNTGPPGAPGTPGAPGAPGSASIADMHGLDIALAEELEGSAPANVVITGATADAAGLATVTFTIKDANKSPVTGRGAVDNSASFGISSLAPKGGGFSYNKWVSYIWRASDNTAAAVNQAYRERSRVGELVEGPAGTYTYTFKQNLGTAKINPANPADNTTVTYDRNRTHRVFVALRAGYTGGNTLDFVPAGGAVTATRDIVEDATCRKCHMATPGHYGPWDGIVKACVTCHAPGNTLKNSAANGGATNTLEMSVMLHKIHAGRELQSVAGPDGQFYDNPNTAAGRNG